jgi:hypothetical protein
MAIGNPSFEGGKSRSDWRMSLDNNTELNPFLNGTNILRLTKPYTI